MSCPSVRHGKLLSSTSFVEEFNKVSTSPSILSGPEADPQGGGLLLTGFCFVVFGGWLAFLALDFN